jgi:hypothetical protein
MSKLRTICAVAAYVAALVWTYAVIVVPFYGYSGFELLWPSTVQIALMFVVSGIPAIWLPISLQRPSRFVVWWLYLVVYVPTVVVSSLSPKFDPELVFTVQTTMLCVLAIVAIGTRIKPAIISQATRARSIFWPLLSIVIGGFLAIILINSGGNVMAGVMALGSGLSALYDVRESFVGNEGPLASAVAYIVPLLGDALNPFLIAYGITRKRWLPGVVGIIGQAVVFGMTGQKSFLFSVGILLAAYFVSGRRRSFATALTSGLAVVVVVAGAIDLAQKGSAVSGVVTRRAILVPGLLTSSYFDYYSRTPYVYFKNGLLKGFTTEEVTAPALEVGTEYFRRPGLSANANVFAEGFAQAGLPGVFGFTLLLIIFLWVYDSVALTADIRLATMLISMQAYVLGDTSILTGLVTHGGILTALLIYCVPREASLPERAQKSRGVFLFLKRRAAFRRLRWPNTGITGATE